MFRGEEIGRLAADEAAAAFTEPLRGGAVSADEPLVSAVVREVEGYPYFIQLGGAELWDAADAADVSLLDEQLLELTTEDIYRRLDVDFYEPRVSTLTPAEQDVLLATAACPYPPLATVNLNEAVDKTPGNVNVLLGRLVEAGVLYRDRSIIRPTAERLGSSSLPSKASCRQGERRWRSLKRTGTSCTSASRRCSVESRRRR